MVTSEHSNWLRDSLSQFESCILKISSQVNEIAVLGTLECFDKLDYPSWYQIMMFYLKELH